MTLCYRCGSTTLSGGLCTNPYCLPCSVAGALGAVTIRPEVVVVQTAVFSPLPPPESPAERRARLLYEVYADATSAAWAALPVREREGWLRVAEHVERGKTP